jgi:aminoglycoside/choline kinase family phosphotransferase
MPLPASSDDLQVFLTAEGWGGAVRKMIAGDSAQRFYSRLIRADGRTAIVLQAPPDHSPDVTPGHKIGDFLRIGAALRGIGIVTPEIYATDVQKGFLLLEDFGDLSFKRAFDGGADPKEMYGLAVDVLRRMQSVDVVAELPDYYASHVHKGRRRIVDWYLPAVRRDFVPVGAVESYLAVWDSIEKSLPPCPQGFLHIDYHVENLMFLPDRDGLARCGVLDFQGAMRGALPYDLGNLLEDARIDVAPDLRRAMLERYCETMSTAEREIFTAWYRVVTTQFHCRVIGQFIRLALVNGKTQYLKHIPRVAGYLQEGLQHPLLAPMQEWFAKEGVDFTSPPRIDLETLKHFIAKDAF